MAKKGKKRGFWDPDNQYLHEKVGVVRVQHYFALRWGFLNSVIVLSPEIYANFLGRYDFIRNVIVMIGKRFLSFSDSLQVNEID
jgi:hypothetical protein